MSNKVMSLVGVFVAGLGFLAATTQGCGGSIGARATSRPFAMQGCAKTVSCTAGSAFAITMAECLQTCNATGELLERVARSSAAGQKCVGISDCVAAAYVREQHSRLRHGKRAAPRAARGHVGQRRHLGRRRNVGRRRHVGQRRHHGRRGRPGSGGVFGTAGTAGSTCATACAKADACCLALPNADRHELHA